VLDLHNIESVLHERSARAGGIAERLAHGVFARACLALERTWLPRYSLLLAASCEDAAAVSAIAPDARVTVYPNALPAAPRPPRAEDDVIVFSGNLEYHPNISAVRFFRRRVWPELCARWPGLARRSLRAARHALQPWGTSSHFASSSFSLTCAASGHCLLAERWISRRKCCASTGSNVFS
jgi:hypothetical protein